ncbi:MAG: hypothetical protein ABIW82_17215 [Dokdonella sp.]
MTIKAARTREGRHAQFIELTATLGLIDIEASALLGFTRSVWSMYRHQRSPVPKYAVMSLASAVALKAAAPRVFNQWLNAFREKS